MAEENKGNYSKYLLGIVGIVAVVGLFTLLINYNKGGIEDVSGAAVFRPAQQNQNSCLNLQQTCKFATKKELDDLARGMRMRTDAIQEMIQELHPEAFAQAGEENND